MHITSLNTIILKFAYSSNFKLDTQTEVPIHQLESLGALMKLKSIEILIYYASKRTGKKCPKSWNKRLSMTRHIFSLMKMNKLMSFINKLHQEMIISSSWVHKRLRRFIIQCLSSTVKWHLSWIQKPESLQRTLLFLLWENT